MSTTSLANPTLHAHHTDNRTLFGRIRAACVDVYRAVAYRRALASLHELDDHMLNDIGLARSDIALHVVARRRD